MKFFFDESGSFAVKNPGPHIMVGLVYPELFENKLKKFFSEYVSSLTPEEFDKDEPKGQLLSLKSRKKLFSFLNDNSWLKIGVSLTDSEFNSVYEIQQYRNEQLSIYKNQFSDPIFQGESEELINLQKLIDDFSINDGLNNVLIVKGLLLMYTLYSLFIASLNYYTAEVYDNNWHKLSVCFDRLDKNIITRMENWVNREFLNLITVRNAKNPIELDTNWFMRNHPILKFRDGKEDRLILNKMFKDKFTFEFSDNSFQLQIVDWISNTLFKVIKKELPIQFLNSIEDNLIKYNGAKIHVMVFSNINPHPYYNKYKDFL